MKSGQSELFGPPHREFAYASIHVCGWPMREAEPSTLTG